MALNTLNMSTILLFYRTAVEHGNKQ